MNTLNRARLEAMLGLLAIRGIGSSTVRRLLPYVPAEPDLPSLQFAIATAALKPHLRHTLLEAVTGANWEQHRDAGRRVLEQADRYRVQLVPWDAPAYPPYLKIIPDAPAVLYAKGRLARDVQTVACVGTREPSTFGCSAAERMTGFLAEHGWTIVSGLAKGVDTIAHQAALAAAQRTVAILGNGLDRVYPAENTHLAEEILAAGGLLLSEQPCGTKPSPANLVQRDRLQSGMSVATIVFETSVNGGAMRTARFTQHQQRLLLCPVPPARYIDSPSCGGINLLLAEGVHGVLGREAYPALVRRLEQESQRLASALVSEQKLIG